MKRTILFLTLAFGILALVSAQGNNRWGPTPPGPLGTPRGPHSPQGRMFPNGPGFHHGMMQQHHSWGRGYQRSALPAAETVSVSGNLAVVRGMIAVTSGDTSYLVGGLNRFIGFIDGLKEGAAVTLEGYAMSSLRDDKVKFLRVQTMTIGGKDYELARPRQEREPRQQQPQQRGRR